MVARAAKEAMAPPGIPGVPTERRTLANRMMIIMLMLTLIPQALAKNMIIKDILAYRMAEGVDKNWVANINSIFPKADLGFFIDITPEESIRRNTDTKFNIKASAEHLAKVRNAYLSIINENNLIHVNGMQPIEYIFDEVISNIEEYRKRYGKRI